LSGGIAAGFGKTAQDLRAKNHRFAAIRYKQTNNLKTLETFRYKLKYLYQTTNKLLETFRYKNGHSKEGPLYLLKYYQSL